MRKLGFSIFCVLGLNKKIINFLGLLKHYKIVVSANFGVFVVEREKRAKKMITGIPGFGFFLSKNGRFVTHNCFSKNALLKPLCL